jgi:hypothetical protein
MRLRLSGVRDGTELSAVRVRLLRIAVGRRRGPGAGPGLKVTSLR